MPIRIVDSLSAVALAAVAFAAGVNGAAGARPPGRVVSHVSDAASSVSPMHGRHPSAPSTGEEIFRATCAGCHGADGRGTPRTTVGFAVPLPDFTDCNVGTREADVDWRAIVRDGGPVRGISRIMPAFRDLLTPEQIRSVVAYLRTLCRGRGWPRGEFNLPLALITEKAFPEDEVVLTSTIDTHGPGAVENHLIFEKRFGARDQIEVDVPFGFRGRPRGASWVGGLGDVSIAPKHVFYSSLAKGTIVSGLMGVILPTGSRATGLGTGTTAFEGFLLAAQLLPRRSYFQFQGGVELPTDPARAARTASWSGVLGTTLAAGPISRIWSPAIEVAGSRDLVRGASVDWDMVPQLQVSLSALQHVRAGAGIDVPLTQTEMRRPQIRAYVLWDTFDGPLSGGWKGWCPGCQH
ncbi:MAG: c-type cytochrome [Gemmatimonadaceae bacterium]